MISVAARKAKGRRLQNWVVSILTKLFGFTSDDIRPAIMGETGTDVKLSSSASVKFPYAVECKNQEGFASIYNAYSQAVANSNGLEPLLIIRSNRKPALAVLSAEHFFQLTRNNYDKKH